MGAEFNFRTLKADTKKDAVVEGQKIIKQALYDHGHAGYSGSFAECTGVEFAEAEPFLGIGEAERWLEENADKWGPMLICEIKDGGGEKVKFVVGAWCSS